MVGALQPCRISKKGSFWSGALGCSNTLARRRFYIILPAIFLTLSGCEEKVIAVGVKPPPALLTCAGEPLAPILPPRGIERDRIVTEWVLAYRAAWADCASKIAGVRKWADTLPD